MVDPLFARGTGGIEEQRPQNCRETGIEELRRRDLAIFDFEQSRVGLRREVKAKPFYPARRT